VGRFKPPCGEFGSPAWHAKELAETEQRLAEGKEEVMDWEKAKERLSKIDFEGSVIVHRVLDCREDPAKTAHDLGEG